MDESTNLEQLSGPVGAPAPLGQAPITTGGFTPNAQKFAPSLSGTNTTGQQPTMPIGAGNTMFPETSGALPVFAQDQIGNVSGVVDSQVEAPLEAEIPTMTNSVEGETEIFAEADATDGGGRKAARSAKTKDRRADRKERDDAGLKGGKKRQARRAQRRQRKAAWKDYKAEATLDDADF
tara:strand:+ start:77 stop:613 length:537 start_codon:yes stop_codon:yes gene_type:complete